VLPGSAIDRRHAPETEAESDRGYERFRPCLRWEFSFACPFCLLHEAQVSPTGAAGSAQFWIEHLEPQSVRPDLRNSYGNVVYACRRCNLARHQRPRIDGRGRQLLDPCAEAWSVHFGYEGDEFVPLGPDAQYTATTYDINSPVKVALRRERREAIDEALHVLATVPQLLDEVMTGTAFLTGRNRELRLDVAERLHKDLASARRTLVQLSAVPADADDECACAADACVLAEHVVATLLHLDFGSGRQ
jgi:hypothetical protein